MPEVEYATTVAAPVERVWNYVEDLNQWCHLMIGYQALEIVDERKSVWTLRGDVGILTREVKIQVDITEWIPRERVAFTVTGISERLEGGGAFLMSTIGEPTSAEDPAAPSQPSPVRKKQGLLRRLRFRMARAILRRVGRKAAKAQAERAANGAGVAVTPAAAPTAGALSPAAPVAAPLGSRSGEAAGQTSLLTFQLRVTPLGPMAPMLDLLMAPMLEPAAQDLADGIRAAVET